MDFEYKASLPSEEGKGGNKFGKGHQQEIKKVDIFKAAKEKEMISRVVNRVKLSTDGWTELRKDLDNSESKNYISRKFGIKPNDLKWLKKYLGYS